jgi:hypothetical protein
VPTAGRSRTITICYLEPSTINAAVAHVPPSLPVLLAMASTTQQETHDVLGSIMQEMHNTLHTMVADKLKIAAEQQECLYKLEVMAGIESAVTEPPLLPTKAATGTSVPPPLPYTPSPQPVVWLEPPPTEAAGCNRGRRWEGHILWARDPTGVGAYFPHHRRRPHLQA